MLAEGAMAKRKLPDPQVFAEEFERLGASGVARKYEVEVRNVFQYRRSVEDKLGRPLNVPSYLDRSGKPRPSVRKEITVDNSMCMIIGSDAHYESNTVTTAHLAFVDLAKKLQPDVIVMNGDMMDGASISRHAPLGIKCPPSISL